MWSISDSQKGREKRDISYLSCQSHKHAGCLSQRKIRRTVLTPVVVFFWCICVKTLKTLLLFLLKKSCFLRPDATGEQGIRCFRAECLLNNIFTLFLQLHLYMIFYLYLDIFSYTKYMKMLRTCVPKEYLLI